MAAALPSVHLEVIEGCGHAVHIECPRKLVEAIERFRRRFPPHAAPRPQAAAPRAVPVRAETA
jgi:alpha-beta hydrolase superfamily lysophospholipase